MKRKLCLLFILPLLFAACENVLPVEEVDLSSMVAEFTTPTKTVTFEGHVVDMDYLVTSADLETYLELQPNSPNGLKRPVKSVEAKGPNADVPLMYVVNYDKGWEILSADKRAQPVLAFSDGGEFSFETANPGERVWLEGLACDVLNLRTADKALQSRAAENNPNVGFWRGLEVRKKMMEEGFAETRASGDSLDFSFDPLPIFPINPLPEGGHYEFSHTYKSYMLETEVGHMTTTSWHQWSPWNVKCPRAYDTDDTYGEEYVPAGCVALAISQILYYMHNKVGVPTSAPTNAYYTGQYNPWDVFDWGLSFTLDGMSSSMWNMMATSGGQVNTHTNAVASLIAHVGYLSGMNYTDTGSGADDEDALEGACHYYGITGTLLDGDDYNTLRIIDNLRDSLVVYASAWNDDGDGHAFVIDGYRDYKVTYHDVYDWVWDIPQDPDGPQIKVPGYTITRNTNSVECLFICINWGWGSYYNNDNGSPVWYAPTGHWTLDGENYDLDRLSIVDFRIL